MSANRYGRIINISSVVGSSGNLGQSNYSASKAGLEGMSKSIALEVASRGITVNCIAPGLVKTDFARAIWENPDRHDYRKEKTPLRRIGEPRDIAGIAVYMASEAGAWTTGQTVVIDGGVTAVGDG